MPKRGKVRFRVARRKLPGGVRSFGSKLLRVFALVALVFAGLYLGYQIWGIQTGGVGGGGAGPSAPGPSVPESSVGGSGESAAFKILYGAAASLQSFFDLLPQSISLQFGEIGVHVDSPVVETMVALSCISLGIALALVIYRRWGR
ncbi:MAG: hypothetical protein NZ992_00215 [Candidatus Korarchaeum sp.]|nr:hypothetical protein [Candidatus Korarchaeum sp.]